MLGCCCCVLFLLQLFCGSCLLAKVKLQQNKVIGCLLQKLYINIFLGILNRYKQIMLAEVRQLSNLLLLLLMYISKDTLFPLKIHANASYCHPRRQIRRGLDHGVSLRVWKMRILYVKC